MTIYLGCGLRSLMTWLVSSTCLVVISHAIYMPPEPGSYRHKHQTTKAKAIYKTAEDVTGIIRRHSAVFKNDKEIARYLNAHGFDLMLWRCRNAIQPVWNSKPLQFVELYCEVIGTMKFVTWQHNNKDLAFVNGGKYSQQILPHKEHGRYYSRWIDFRLRIHNATQRDAGVYTFSVTSPGGSVDRQTIYVDISERNDDRHNRITRRRDAKTRPLEHV